MCSYSVKETMPGPECKTDEDLRNHVKDSLCTTFRACFPDMTYDHSLRYIYLRYIEYAEHASSGVKWCRGLELARVRDEEHPSHRSQHRSSASRSTHAM